MSYRILTATDVICDSTNPANGCENPILKQAVNKVWEFEFTLAPDHPYFDKITERQTELGVSLDGEDPIFWGMVYATKTDFYGRKTFFVEDMLGYFNDAVVKPYRYTGKNITEVLQTALTVYNGQITDKPISLGNVSTTHTAHDLAWSSNYETVLDMLQTNVIGKNGGYLRMRYDYANAVRYLDYSEAYGGTTQVISIGSNLMDFVRDSDKSAMVSILIPLGARLPESEQDIVGVEKRLTIYTAARPVDRIESQTLVTAIGRKVGTRIWDNVEDPDALATIGTNFLANQLEKVTIEAKAFDLNLADEEVQAIRLYDEVRILSAPHNLDSRFPVMELTMNLNNPASNTLVLGKTELPSIVQNTVQNSEQLEQTPTFVDAATQAAQQAAQVLENATNGYIQFVYNSSTGILEEILIKDLTDPEHKWWRWNVNGLGYTSDGGSTYDVAMTMLGQLVSNYAVIGGWEVNSSGLYKTVAEPNDSTKQYRVTIYTPNTATPDSSPVIDFQYSSDGGNSFTQLFYIPGNGSMTVYSDNQDGTERISIVQRNNSTNRTILNSNGVHITQAWQDWVAKYCHLWSSLLEFRDSNNDLTASYDGDGWKAYTVTDLYADNNTLTWRVLRNGNFYMCVARREFSNINVNYQWGSIWNGYSSAQYPNGTDCHFKPDRKSVV